MLFTHKRIIYPLKWCCSSFTFWCWSFTHCCCQYQDRSKQHRGSVQRQATHFEKKKKRTMIADNYRKLPPLCLRLNILDGHSARWKTIYLPKTTAVYLHLLVTSMMTPSAEFEQHQCNSCISPGFPCCSGSVWVNVDGHLLCEPVMWWVRNTLESEKWRKLKPRNFGDRENVILLSTVWAQNTRFHLLIKKSAVTRRKGRSQPPGWNGMSSNQAYAW